MVKGGWGILVCASSLCALAQNLPSATIPNTSSTDTSTVAATAVTAPPIGDDIAQGLWWLYQLDYEKARRSFEAYIEDHPKDSAGYFYAAATDWWQLAQQFDQKLPLVESRFEEDYERATAVGKKQLADAKTNDERAEACLYWGGAEGLKGRWLVTQKQWVKAYFLGKRGNALLHRALRYNPSLYDAYMGIGIYDYFTDTLSGAIRAISTLLIHGNRKRGLKELQLAIDHGRRSRVESMIFLVEIYTTYEHQPEKALALAETLRNEFPLSPAMHLAQIMAYYHMKRWDDVRREAQIFYERSQKETPFYKKEGLEPANYCLGMAALMGSHDLNGASVYFDTLLKNEGTSRWITFAYLRRGQIHDVRGERSAAVEDYQRVLQRANFWGSRSEAQQYLKQPYAFPNPSPVSTH